MFSRAGAEPATWRGTRALATRVAYEVASPQGYAGSKAVREARSVAGVADALDLTVLSDRG